MPEVSASTVSQVDPLALDVLFNEARTHNVWQEKEVEDKILEDLYSLMKMAPTSMNISPARIVFVKRSSGKERLRPALVSGNVEKTMTAPVCAVIGYDVSCWKNLNKLFPFKDMSQLFENNPEFAETTAFRNGSMQGAYFILAARSLGLDCGPMSGFDNARVDEEFFAGTEIKSNFLCNLGYGVWDNIPSRAPRLQFGEVCKII